MITTQLEHELLVRLMEAEDISKQHAQNSDELHERISALQDENAYYEEELRTLRNDYDYTRDQLDLREYQLTEKCVDNTYQDCLWYCVYLVVFSNNLQPVGQYTDYEAWVEASYNTSCIKDILQEGYAVPPYTTLVQNCSAWLRKEWAARHKTSALLHEED